MVNPHAAKQRRFRRQLRVGKQHLVGNCALLAGWIETAGAPAWSIDWEREPYEALVHAVAHQQLHGRAAQTILARFCAGFRGNGFPTPRQVVRADVDKLRGMGFSAAKVAAIQGIAQATLEGRVPSREEAEQLSDEELVQRLVALRGIGRWTVEMLLIFTLGRLDVMPVDDFGIKSGLRALHRLEGLPGKQDFPALTDHWRPHRSLAAWYLWRLADTLKN